MGKNAASALHVDLEENVVAFGSFGPRRPVEIAVELSPFEKAGKADTLFKRGPLNEDVGVTRLAGATAARRPATGQPQAIVILDETLSNRALTYPSRARQHDDQGAAQLLLTVASKDARC